MKFLKSNLLIKIMKLYSPTKIKCLKFSWKHNKICKFVRNKTKVFSLKNLYKIYCKSKMYPIFHINFNSKIKGNRNKLRIFFRVLNCKRMFKIIY